MSRSCFRARRARSGRAEFKIQADVMGEKVLLIDNYDSFTYNLVQYLGELGAEVEVRRNDEVTINEVEGEIRPDRVVVSPGPGTPDEAGVTLELIGALAGHVPVLGVCLGHQAIGQIFGGRVVRGPAPVHGKPAEICHDGKTIFEGLENRFPAGRYHSPLLERGSFPPRPEASAPTTHGPPLGLPP